MKWLKNKLRHWLGIESIEKSYNKHDNQLFDLNERLSSAMSIGVDVHFKKPHMIIIFSSLKGGQIRHIDTYFNNIKDLELLVKELKLKYKPRNVFWDTPQMFKY